MTHTNPNMPIQTEFPEMMTVPELSQYLRISKPILYGLIREGKTPSVRFGRQIRAYRGDVIRMFQNAG